MEGLPQRGFISTMMHSIQRGGNSRGHQSGSAEAFSAEVALYFFFLRENCMQCVAGLWLRCSLVFMGKNDGNFAIIVRVMMWGLNE